MKIDAAKLMTDAHRLREASKAGNAPGRTGATELIATALPAILRLREQNVAWDVIAAALAEQGAVQGPDRKPLKGRRLCALLSALMKREARRARKARVRLDVVPQRGAAVITIAPELAVKSRRRAATVSESELRAEAFANLQPFLKGQNK
jgi:hypothetical protein